jgi:hypothetical protein
MSSGRPNSLIDDWQTRFTFLTLLAIIFMTVHMRLLPYRIDTDNHLEMTTSSSCSLTSATLRGSEAKETLSVEDQQNERVRNIELDWAWWQYLFGWYLAPRSK